MEKRFKFLFLLLCCLISSSAIAQQRLRDVSKQEAFSLVKDNFSGQDVDYYLCEDPVLKIEGENNITVTPTLTNNKFSAIAISSQGEMAQESITLESKTGFKSISPTPVEDFIDIELHCPVKSGNAVLRINSLAQTGSILLSKHIPLDAKKIQLDATSLPSGIYVLTYSVDNQIVDSRKFSKK